MSKLTLNESVGDFTHIYTATFAQLQAIGNGGQVTIATIPAGGAVELVYVDERVAFAGTTSLVMTLGQLLVIPMSSSTHLTLTG